jgi:hypothetical protein
MNSIASSSPVLQKSRHMHKTVCAAPAIVQLDQTEFRTSYAERERISVTGSPLPKRSRAAFRPIATPSDHGYWSLHM